jgi:hypothetical protein
MFTLVAKVTNIPVVTFATILIKVLEVHFLLWLNKRPQCLALLIQCSLLHCILLIKKGHREASAHYDCKVVQNVKQNSYNISLYYRYFHKFTGLWLVSLY